MAKYERITKYAGELAENPGKWTEPVMQSGTLRLGEFVPSEKMRSFVEDFYADYWDEVQEYDAILKEAGIDPILTSTADFDMDSLDARTVLALIMKAIRADRFCEGVLGEAAKSGYLDECLNRLNEIDAEDEREASLPGEIVSLADEILSAMEELPDGTELTAATAIELTREYQGMSHQGDELCYMYEGLALSQYETWDFGFALMKRAKDHGLLLDNSDLKDMAIGTLENIPFLVKHLK